MADIKLFGGKNLSRTTIFVLLENKVFSINSRIILYFFENSRELNVYLFIYFKYIISPFIRYFARCFYDLVRLLSVGSPCWAHVRSLDTVASQYIYSTDCAVQCIYCMYMCMYVLRVQYTYTYVNKYQCCVSVLSIILDISVCKKKPIYRFLKYRFVKKKNDVSVCFKKPIFCMLKKPIYWYIDIYRFLWVMR